jgi:maleate cis-trans isomerase
MNSTPRLGFLYPGHSGEDDYPRMSVMVEPPVHAEVVHTTIGEDAHREDALRDTGNEKRLLAGAEALRQHGVDAAMWACTSGSFVFGLEGARAQAAAVEKFLGAPVSSTSLAFVAALEALGIRQVSIAASYPQDIALLLGDFLASAGVSVVHVGSLGIITGVEVGTLTRDDVLSLVRQNDHSQAQAILVPDTAMHTAGWIDDLEAAVGGKTVLTANQVTMWEALRLAGHPGCAAGSGLGSLFTRVGISK